MRSKIVSPAFFVFFVAFVVPSSPAAEPAKVNFTDHVLPVLRDKCLACHNADKARGGLDASNFVKLMEGGSSGAVVKPGDPDESRLYLLTAHKAEPKMPPKADPAAGRAGRDSETMDRTGCSRNRRSKAPLIVKKSEVASGIDHQGPADRCAADAQGAVAADHSSHAAARGRNRPRGQPVGPACRRRRPALRSSFINTDTLDLVGSLPSRMGRSTSCVSAGPATCSWPAAVAAAKRARSSSGTSPTAGC